MKLFGKADKVAAEACEKLGLIEKIKAFFENSMNKDSNQPIEIGDPVKISVIAPSRAGKTSLISCIYQEIEDINKPDEMDINTDEESRDRLKEFERNTADMIAAEKNITEIAINDVMAGTAERKEFRFDINLKTSEIKGKNQIERVLKQGYEIQDIPGGWIDAEASKKLDPDKAKQRADFEKFLNDSTILYIPIEAPILVEPSGKEEIKVAANLLEIGNVREIVLEWIRSRKRKSSLVFIPIKCECYLKNENKANKLKQKVMEKYGEIRDKAQNNEFINTYYVPVETLGCVEFTDGNWSLTEGNQYFYGHYKLNRTSKGGYWQRKDIDKLAADIFKHSAWEIKKGIDEKQKILDNASFIAKLTNANLKNYKKELKVIEGALKPMIETFENTYDKDLTEKYRV